MKVLAFSIITALAGTALHAQPMTGTWYGSLDVKKSKLPLVFHISKDAKGYDGTMDSPDQGAAGIKMDTVYIDKDSIIIEKRSMRVRYAGLFDSTASQVRGTFRQGPAQLPLLLTRIKEEVKTIPRPQDPKDFPYSQEEVFIKNTKDTVTLAGTLTLPKDKKADRIVILITGSGPQNRNEEIKQFNHRPFLIWSDWLTRHGIAVLRYDDRGVGNSTGDFNKATSADFANDAAAAIDFIKSRSDLKDMQLGLIGHSEGGMIAPMLAAKDKRVQFIVLLAGPGAPIEELMQKQGENSDLAMNMPKNVSELNRETNNIIYDYLKKHAGEPEEKIEPEFKKILTDQFDKYPADAIKGTTVATIVARQLQSTLVPWFRYFITYIPAINLEKVKCPVLAINGTLDKQVDATQNLTAIEAALKKAKNKHYEIAPLPGLNHLLQKATTGNVSEYGTITETVNEAALNKVTDWINKQ